MRGHSFLGIIGGNAKEQLAFRRVARSNRSITPEISQGAFLDVQTQLGLALFGIRTMAVKTIVGQDWSNISVKRNLICVGEAKSDGEGHRKQSNRLKIQGVSPYSSILVIVSGNDKKGLFVHHARNI